MASHDTNPHPSATLGTHPIPPSSHSAPVEMADLQSSKPVDAVDDDPSTSAPPPQPQPPPPEQDQDATAGAEAPAETSTPAPPTTDEPSITATTDTQQRPAGAALTRAPTEALGPATDAPIVPPPPSNTARGPVLSITLMLTTGARHPYKIDERYLRNRKVSMPLSTTPTGGQGGEGSGFDPREISGYKLKELIWTDWRSEWEPRPASPSSIRLIILGRLVEDKAALKDFPFKLDDANVGHMTVKPADLLEDEEAAAGKGPGVKGHGGRGGRDAEDRGAGCRCVIL